MGAADSFCAGFGEAEVLYLACLNEVFDGPGSLFDGRVLVDAVLVEEVDGVGLQTLERSFDDLLDVVGTAVGCSPLAIIIRIGLKTELGGDDVTTSLRNGARASPTTSSLIKGP